MKSIFKIISFTRHLWKWYVFMSLFVVVISLLNLAGPLLSKQIVDRIVLQLQGNTVPFSEFVIILSVIIAADITITILTAFSQWIGDLLTVKLQTYLTKTFYQHVLSLHIGYFDHEITGTIVNKMYRGIAAITDFIQSMFNNFLPFFLSAFVTILLLGKFSIIIAFLLAILFPIYILISHGSTIAWGKYERKKNILADVSQGRVFEAVSGIRVVKSFAAQGLELKSFLAFRGKIEAFGKQQTKEWHIYDFLRRFVLNIILFAIYAYIVGDTFHGRFTIGEMTLLIQLINQARFPLFAMSFILGQIQQASAGSEDFFRVLSVKNQIADIENGQILKFPSIINSKKPLIEFKNVSFNYDNGNNILHDVSFAINMNEKLALVGESGQGKSTIVNLLLRYYEPQIGIISLNGQNIGFANQESLHRAIGVVFQESLLFSGSVMENIRYGKPNATDAEIYEAALAANAHEFIEKLSNKYNSLIGERGIMLSGGQKQRIAIARAILKNAPIIILDEATSSLDSKSEMLVQKGLDRLLKDRTSIIIAHRLSTITSADHILVIHKGTVAEYGTSGELIQKGGLYAQLVNLQHSLLKISLEENKTKKLKEFDIIG